MKRKGAKTNAIVETIDIFPTLCDLTGVEIPKFASGVSLKEMLDYPNITGHSAVAYTKKASTIRTETHRMTLHKDGFVELYDHTTAESETKNVADKHPELVEELKQALQSKLQ
jgi:iduronate 2-sulfatase